MTMQERAREWLQDRTYGATDDDVIALATLLTTIRAEALEEAAVLMESEAPSPSSYYHSIARKIRSLIPQERT